MKVLVNICRFVLALALVFSGYVKAIDPLGTQYKIEDYLGALGLREMVSSWLTLGTSVALSALEFCLGIFLLFAIHRRLVSRLAVVLMAVMTLVTVWLWIANPITDCGCFGDAIILTNGQTLLKNIILLGCAIVVARKPLCMVRFISESNQWIVIHYTVLFVLLSSLWCLYALPLFDFRPYHIGANIPKGMEMPEGEKGPEFETTFILEKNGERREFTLDNYPDSTWTFVDSRTEQVSEGYVPPIHDLSIERIDTGEDITDEVLQDEGYTFLLVAPWVEKASDTNFGEIEQLYEYAHEHGYPFYCLTSSNEDAIERWRELTGAEYPFCFTDATTLKTIIRSNPGLVLLKNGTVIRKWSHNMLPVLEQEQMAMPMEQLEIGQIPQDSVPRKLGLLLLWFVLPLFLLTLADRLWAWTKWLRRSKRKREVVKDSPATLEEETITTLNNKKEKE